MATRRSAPTSFEPPPTPSPAVGGPEGSAEFEPPDVENAFGDAPVEAEALAFMAGVDERLMAAKAQVEEMLTSISSHSGTAQAMAASMEANVVGVGIGLGDGLSPGVNPGDPVLEVYTIEPEAPSETRARMAAVAGVQALASDVPMKMVRTGIIDAFQHRMRLRPAPGGISVGHVRVTAGTLGCLARGRSGPRLNRLMVLSNNHVLADSNAGALGDPIIQPGAFDGGRMPADQIAVLEKFIRMDFAGGNNLVDCATGWAWPDRVRRELMYLTNGAPRFFNVGSVPVAAVPGLSVGKSGRTTQLTSGRVTAVGVTINVNYGGGRVARFINQIAVRASSGDFSQGGDSGSLIWTWDARRAPVGLLFAGGGGTTFANRISDVLAQLDINLVT